jgi:hypothetical protein
VLSLAQQDISHDRVVGLACANTKLEPKDLDYKVGMQLPVLDS